MKYINLDLLPSHTKLELAEKQLDRSICLLLDFNDAVCAITLAGAAEEILGKLIEVSGRTHSLKAFIDECLAAGQKLSEI